MKTLFERRLRLIAFLPILFLIIALASTQVPFDQLKLYLYGTAESEMVDIVIPSKALGRDMAASVYLPKGYKPNGAYPVVYWFHGHGAGYTQLFYDTNAISTFEDLVENQNARPMIIVCPQIDSSYGLNSGPEYRHVKSSVTNISVDFGPYEDYFFKDVIPYIESHYSISQKKEDRTIAGFSMGGHIALRLGFDHKDYFGKIGAHAPAILGEDYVLAGLMKDLLYPTQALFEKRNPLEMAKVMDLKGLQVYMDIGSRDRAELLQGCKSLAASLEKQNVSVTFQVNEGNHSVDYLISQMVNYLTFYNSPTPQ